MDSFATVQIERARAALDVLHARKDSESEFMDAGERKRYSLRAVLDALNEGRPRSAGLEFDVHSRVAAMYGEPNTGNGVYLPWEILCRDLNVASTTAGGFLVGTSNLPDWVPALRARSTVIRAGAQVIDGLRNNLTLPKLTTGATAGWIASETTPIAESTPVTAQLAMTPKRVGAYVEYSRQLALQSSPGVDRVIAADLLDGIGTAIDKAAIQGAGSGGEPLGVIGSGVGTQSGTALAIAGLLAMQSTAGNALGPTAAYIAALDAAAILAARGLLAGTAQPLWNGSLIDARLAGLPALGTANMPAASLLLGTWSDLIVGFWSPPVVEIDPYSSFKSGILGVRCHAAADIGLRRVGSFVYSATVT